MLGTRNRVIHFLLRAREALHFRIIRAELRRRIYVLLVEIRLVLEKVVKISVGSNVGELVNVAGLCNLIKRLFFYQIGLSIREGLIDIRKLLCRDILLLVNGPDLIFALVGNLRSLGFLHLDAQLL